MEEYLIPKEEVADLLYNNPQQSTTDRTRRTNTKRQKRRNYYPHMRWDNIYLFICSNTIEHKTILSKQLHEQDNKAVINSADSCPN